MFRHHCVIIRELAFITLTNYMMTHIIIIILFSLVNLQILLIIDYKIYFTNR